MPNILTFIKFLLFAALNLTICVTICPAQNKTDIEVTAQAAAETARGGETFSYTVTVKNIGPAKATRVILMQDGNSGETSASPSAGTCALLKESSQIPTPFQCRLGDLEKGESVIINFSIKIHDFGGEPEESMNSPTALPTLPDFNQSPESQADQSKTTLADIDVSAEETDENSENNRAVVRAELLPSKNLPPRVAVISPKSEIVIVKPISKSLEVPLIIKAFDPDGKITKVRVLEQNFQIIIEDNQYKFVFGGKKYTAQEAEDRHEELASYFGGDAVQNSDGTYGYVWKSPRYGKNRVSIDAVDDGGRTGSTTLEIEVKSDAAIEIVAPQNEQLFPPNSNVTIETISKISDGVTPQVRLLGTQPTYPMNFTDLPLMRQVSKTGNTYKHQFIWKGVKEGVYDLVPMVLENDQDTNTTGFVRIVVAEPRVIKITSLKNGQVFDAQKPVEIKIEARDSKGGIVNDEFELMIDGKSYVKINNSLCENCMPKSYIWNPPFLTKGIHTVQIIAKNFQGIKLGQSETITIKVK
jgi:hypothetical protein